MDFTQLATLFTQAPIIDYIGYFFLFNLLLTSLEFFWDLWYKKQRRWKDTRANILLFFLHQFLDKTVVGSIGIIALAPIQYFALFEIPRNLWTWILAVFAADFTYYWMHRIEHEHRILWASHSVHHSSEDYNLTIAMRLSIVEGLFEWIFLIPMILFGFSPFQAIVGLVLVAQYQTWIHTEHIGKLGWLDEILNTPSTHRVHHGSNNKYLDKNYGGILILWDKLFGTFQREEEKVIYGLTKNIKTNHLIAINFKEYFHIYQDVKKCKTLQHKLRIIFGNLIWKPAYFQSQKKE